MLRILSTLGLALFLCGCAVGKPLGFGEGDTWTIPLVAPLENGDLLAPVMINDKGPYLFIIDADARYSAVDARIVNALQLIGRTGVELPDERDRLVRRAQVEIMKLQIGNLTVSNTKFNSYPSGSRALGRPVYGVIGSDIIAESLVFEVNRDEGVTRLYTNDAWKRNEPNWSDAKKVSYRDWSDQYYGRVVPRRIVKANVGGKSRELHLDFGGMKSSIHPSHAKGWKSLPITGRGQWVDEHGSRQDITKAFIAPELTVAGMTSSEVLMVPYLDKRWRNIDVQGTIGSDFLSRYIVAGYWHKDVVYFRPRIADLSQNATARMKRWKTSAFQNCTSPGCASVELEDVKSEDNQVVGAMLKITPEAAAPKIDYEITIQVGDKFFGATIPSQGRGETMLQSISSATDGEVARIVDVSPFAPPCNQVQGQSVCVRLIR